MLTHRSSAKTGSQWWELIDARTGRAYYFRPETLESSWKRPTDLNAVIIPLARLHVLPNDHALLHSRAPPSAVLRRDNCTQTALRAIRCASTGTQTGPTKEPALSSGTMKAGDFRSLRQYLMAQAKCAGVYDDQYWGVGSEEEEDDDEEEEDEEEEDDDEEYEDNETANAIGGHHVEIERTNAYVDELDSVTSEMYTEDVGFEDNDDDDDDDDEAEELDAENKRVSTVRRKSECNLIEDLEHELKHLDHLDKLQRLSELERLEQLEQVQRLNHMQPPSIGQASSSRTSGGTSVDSWQIKDESSKSVKLSAFVNPPSSNMTHFVGHDEHDYEGESYEPMTKSKSMDENHAGPKPPTRINSLTPAQTLLNKPLPSKSAAKKCKSNKKELESSKVKRTLKTTDTAPSPIISFQTISSNVAIPKPLPQTPKEAEKAQKALKKQSKQDKRGTKSLKQSAPESLTLGSASSLSKQGDYSSSIDAANEQLHEYAKEHMKRHLSGGGLKHVFKRQRSTRRMLEWTKSSLKQPMLATGDAGLKSQAIDAFRMVQMYCGDRPPATYLPLDVDRLCDQIAFDLITIAMARNGALKDELLVQLCRQSTKNPNDQSVHRALRLLCTCLYYFSPSATFAPYLAGFLTSHEHQFARDLCSRRLRKRCGHLILSTDTNGSATMGRSSRTANRKSSSASGSSNHSNSTLFGSNSSGYGSTGTASLYASTSATSCNSGYNRTPASVEEVRVVRIALEERYGGVFGESLEAQVSTQSSRWPNRKLPWVLVGLCEAILRLQGARQEGIFRIAGDVDEMSGLKLYLDCLCPAQCPSDAPEQLVRLAEQWKRQTQRSSSGRSNNPLNAVADVAPVDVHVFACLLKQWFRELPEPLWPRELYTQALEQADDSVSTLKLLQQLPNLNRLVIGYLVRLLQVLSAPANVSHTKMDECNLATVWAPNLLRASLEDEAKFDAVQLFENTRKEMAFVRTLIRHLDTSFVQGLQ